MTKSLDRTAYARVYARVGELAGALGLCGVELRVSERRGSNAWVPANGKRRITFTRQKLSDPELDWTIAHELAHLAAPAPLARRLRYRYRLFVGLHLLVVFALWLRLERDEMVFGLMVMAFFALELHALVHLFAARREEEFRADAVASRLVGPRRTVDFLKHPHCVEGRLSRLLARLEYRLGLEVDERTPLGRLLYLFQSHPTLSERARALREVEVG